VSLSIKCIVCNGENIQHLHYGFVSIDKCNNCGFQYIPNKEKYIGDNFFEEYFNRRSNPENLALNKLRKEQYKIDVDFLAQYASKESKILDVGCSSGEFLYEIYKKCNSNNMFGIDVDQSAINYANETYSHVANFEKLDLLAVEKNMKFDLIVFRGTFQYLDRSLHSSIQHLQNLLAPNARIIIFSLPSTDSFVYYLLKERWALFHPEMSLMFNQKSLNHLFSLYSLGIERLEYPYIEDIYSDIEHDYKQIERIVLGSSKESTPFWGALMRVVIKRGEN